MKISVIVPSYNSEKYLRRCLDCALGQEGVDFEVICVNDGSTDGTLGILQEYAARDARVRIVNQENKGAGTSRNVGIQYAQGDYLFFLDADDWLGTNFLTNMLNRALETGADIVESTRTFNWYSDKHIVLFKKRNARAFTARGTFFRRDVVWDKLFKTDFVRRHRMTFPNGICHNDAFFLLQGLSHGAKVVQEPDAVYYHNKANPSSIRFKLSERKVLSMLDMFILEINYLNSHFFSFYDYRHNYGRLLHTAKTKGCTMKSAEGKRMYREKLAQLINLNKYPYSAFGIFLRKCFSSRFREELRNSKASPKDYPKLLKAWYYKKLGKVLNLENPQTLNEKIQWLKLYDSTPLKTRLADKYSVRDWVAEKIGLQYLVPLLGVYKNFDEIDFTALPNQFVLKCNHGSAMNVVVTDKSKLNLKNLKIKFDNWMRENFGLVKGLQLHYNDISHRIVAEEYIGMNKCTPDDYKVFCFSGVPAFIEYITNRQQKACARFYDANWNDLNWRGSLSSYAKTVEHPTQLAEMLTLAQKLSEGFPFVRVDFYVVKENLFFGEMTFTPGNGISNFPAEVDEKLGDLLQLPNSKSKERTLAK